MLELKTNYLVSQLNTSTIEGDSGQISWNIILCWKNSFYSVKKDIVRSIIKPEDNFVNDVTNSAISHVSTFYNAAKIALIRLGRVYAEFQDARQLSFKPLMTIKLQEKP